MINPLTVIALRSLDAVAALAAQIDALNLASRRPCPFATFEYLQAFVTHEPAGDEQLLFLAALEHGRLVGYLALRRHHERVFGLPYTRVGPLVWHDTDRPHAVARVQDEARCCAAFYRCLLEEERGWSLLELTTQDAASGLNAVPALSRFRHQARRYDNAPNSTLWLNFRTFPDYFQALSRSQRRLVARQTRRIVDAGAVEVLACTDPRGRRAMLELYLDLERRSWKGPAGAAIGNDPRRVEFFRRLTHVDQPLALSFDFILLDGLVIAGAISGAFNGGMHGLEIAFDRDYEDVAPGNLLSLMSIARAIDGGQRWVNLDGNYAYYKARMGVEVTPTVAVQIFRVGSLPWFKARAGEVRRWLFPPPREPLNFNPRRRKVAEAEHDEDESHHGRPRREDRPERIAERDLARTTLEWLGAMGVPLSRLDARGLARRLPFALGPEEKQGRISREAAVIPIGAARMSH